VTGHPRDAELPAQRRHLLSLEQPGDEPEAFVHGSTLLPRHPGRSPNARLCKPCVRNELSAMSREGHNDLHPPADSVSDPAPRMRRPCCLPDLSSVQGLMRAPRPAAPPVPRPLPGRRRFALDRQPEWLARLSRIAADGPLD